MIRNHTNSLIKPTGLFYTILELKFESGCGKPNDFGCVVRQDLVHK